MLLGPTYPIFALQKWRQFLGPSWSSPKACGRVPLRIKSWLLAFPQTTPHRPRVWHTMPFGWYWSSSFGPLKARVRSLQIWYWKKKLDRWHFWTMTLYIYTVHSCDFLWKKAMDVHLLWSNLGPFASSRLVVPTWRQRIGLEYLWSWWPPRT